MKLKYNSYFIVNVLWNLLSNKYKQGFPCMLFVTHATFFPWEALCDGRVERGSRVVKVGVRDELQTGTRRVWLLASAATTLASVYWREKVFRVAPKKTHTSRSCFELLDFKTKGFHHLFFSKVGIFSIQGHLTKQKVPEIGKSNYIYEIKKNWWCSQMETKVLLFTHKKSAKNLSNTPLTFIVVV